MDTLPSARADVLPFSRPPTPRLQLPQIGYHGLGAMGYAMARNLALSVKSRDATAPPLLVYNRTVAKAERLAQDVGDSVRIASSPAQLATECDIIFTNLASDAVVIAVYNEFADALKQSLPTKRKIFVDFSTIYPGVAGDVDSLLSSIPHCHFIASPVIGPPMAAKDGKLLVLMSGDYGAKKEVAYLLVPGVGRKVIDVGGNVEKAHALKLLGNMMLTGANELLAEVQTLGQKSGVGARIVQDLVKVRVELEKHLVQSLPYELIEAILKEAWDTAHGLGRWQLYNSVSALSRLWRTVMLEVALRHVFVESKLDYVAYRSIISHFLSRQSSQIGDPNHAALFKHSLVSIALDTADKPFEITDVSDLVPDAHFMALAILTDIRRSTFDVILSYLVMDKPSITHLRLWGPPLGCSFSYPVTHVVIPSVTHLHVARHPYASLNAILALFSNVTHLRLGTPCFLSGLVSYMDAVQVLILDAPPNYSIHSPTRNARMPPFPSSIPLWNIAEAVDNGLMQTSSGTARKIILNAGKSDAEETIAELKKKCQQRGIELECRRIYNPAWQPSSIEPYRWDYGAWS
ncbi:hypothetical protein BU15DRAFT_70949 [Melanogaster broomeanus]|nr:hypothetical protein BU15DRAFT_70949 [Melanogaster broomeanus]